MGRIGIGNALPELGIEISYAGRLAQLDYLTLAARDLPQHTQVENSHLHPVYKDNAVAQASFF